MNPPLLAAAAAVLTGGLTAVAARPVLARLSEPPDPAGKPPYRELATPAFALGCGVASALSSALTWFLVPPARQAPWVVLATVGVLLAGIDLRTTWLPRSLSQLGWGAMTVAVAVSVALDFSARILLGGVVGALAAGGLYAAVWSLSRGGFGFGDVRFAPLIGAAAGTLSTALLLLALLLGSVLGAVWGLGRLLAGRRGPFPYAPAMLGGGYLAVGWLGLAGQAWPST